MKAAAAAGTVPSAGNQLAGDTHAPMHVRAQLQHGGQAHMLLESGSRDLVVTVRLHGVKAECQCFLHWCEQTFS